MQKGRIIAIGAVALAVLGVILILIFGAKGPAGGVAAPKLTVWGVDSASVFSGVTEAYNGLHQDTSITYVQVDPANYEDKLVRALAAGQGPDVFYVSNHSMYKLYDLMSPLDKTVFNATNLESLYPSVVKQDFTSNGVVYALPLYIDTLALLYNRDMFDRAAITAPPVTWQEFSDDAVRLRVLNEKTQIQIAGAAIGGSEKSVSHATDIVNLLMLQNGTKMWADDFSHASFSGGSDSSGLQAFNFYLSFSNPGSSNYTWNDAQGNSLSAFAAGKAAMLLAYRDDTIAIKKMSPYLSFGIAPIPQISSSTPISYPNYWGLAVSKQTAYPAGAWDLVNFVASTQSGSSVYLGVTGRPPALRTSIASNLNNSELGIFAKQALTARSWYMPDYDKIKEIFTNAMSAVISGQKDARQALKEAEDSVTALRR